MTLLFPHKERGMCAYVDAHIYGGLQIFRVTIQYSVEVTSFPANKDTRYKLIDV